METVLYCIFEYLVQNGCNTIPSYQHFYNTCKMARKQIRAVGSLPKHIINTIPNQRIVIYEKQDPIFAVMYFQSIIYTNSDKSKYIMYGYSKYYCIQIMCNFDFLDVTVVSQIGIIIEITHNLKNINVLKTIV